MADSSQTPVAVTCDSTTPKDGDIAMVILSAALVFIMTPGVGYFYSG